MTLNHRIFARWPAQYRDRLQLFSLPTPNGVKVGIMLEETRLAYEAHRVGITANESHDPAFLALNPNGKIPAIYDPDGPSRRPLALCCRSADAGSTGRPPKCRIASRLAFTGRFMRENATVAASLIEYVVAPPPNSPDELTAGQAAVFGRGRDKIADVRSAI